MSSLEFFVGRYDVLPFLPGLRTEPCRVGIVPSGQAVVPAQKSSDFNQGYAEILLAAAPKMGWCFDNGRF